MQKTTFGALKCLVIANGTIYMYVIVKKRIQLIIEYTGPRLVKSRIDQVDSQKENGYFFQENQSLLELAEPILS